MAAALDPKLQARFTRQGIHLISATRGARLFRSALERSAAHLLIVPIDLRTFVAVWGSGLPLIWRKLLPSAPAEARNTWRDELLAQDYSSRLQALIPAVCAEVARVLSLASTEHVSQHEPLQNLGLDSLMAVELRSALSRRTGLLLPTTTAFHQLTAAGLAKVLADELTSEVRSTPLAGSPAPRAGTASSRLVAHCEPLSRLDAGSRLFCFPDAGGAGAMFLPLVPLRDAGVEIHVISHDRWLPGEKSSRAREYLKTAVEYVQGLSDRPYALFGHSVGALLAWRVAHELIQSGGREPLFLAPSGILPLLPEQGVAQDLNEAVRVLFAAREGLATGTLSSFQADFAADMSLWETLPRAPQHPLPIPISAFMGGEDPLVTQAGMKTWANHTGIDFSLIVLPGDHFYPYREQTRPFLLKELAREFFEACFITPVHAGLATTRVRQRREVAKLP